jgi:serine/threonine-protein kinase
MASNNEQEASKGHVQLEPGTVIKERYCIERCVGSGASSTVYRAIDSQLASLPVAIKVFSRSFMNLPHFQQMYSRELQTSFAVDHENVVRLYDMIRTQSLVALVTEFVDGITLDEFMRKHAGPFSQAQARKVVTSILRGLDAIHSAGLIHRDVKPENVLLSESGAIKINDFGVAKAGQAGKTKGGKRPQVSGTPYYTAPEYLAHGDYDSRSDLHSVGIIAFELLAGKHMFDTSSPAGFLVSKVEAPIPPVLKIVPDCNPALAHVVDRLLQKDPVKRFQTAQEALMELEKLPLSEAGASFQHGNSHFEDEGELPNHMVRKLERSTRRKNKKRSTVSAILSNGPFLYLAIAAIGYYLMYYTEFFIWLENQIR